MVHKSLQTITSLGKSRHWNKIVLSHSCPSPPWCWMRPLPTQLCWHWHPMMFLSFPGSPLPPSCSRRLLAWVGAAEGRQSHPDPDRVWQEKGWPSASWVPSKITPRNGGLRGAPATEALTLISHQCHTGGGQEKQPFRESFPAGSLAPVRDGRARQQEEELHERTELYVLTKRTAEPGWICGQQHTHRKARGCPQLTRGCNQPVLNPAVAKGCPGHPGDGG